MIGNPHLAQAHREAIEAATAARVARDRARTTPRCDDFIAAECYAAGRIVIPTAVANGVITVADVDAMVDYHTASAAHYRAATAAYEWLVRPGQDVALVRAIDEASPGKAQVDAMLTAASAHPTWGLWFTAKIEADDARAEAERKAREAARAADDAAAPARVLAEAEAAIGDRLAVNAKGGVTAPTAKQAASIPPNVLRSIRDHKAAIVALIRNREDAPAVIA